MAGKYGYTVRSVKSPQPFIQESNLAKDGGEHGSEDEISVDMGKQHAVPINGIHHKLANCFGENDRLCT